ncbi:FASCICLIN-LIKE ARABINOGALACTAN PROTEIN 11 [Salix koriyanagi]|uniref:FASCICLIN-LIKE ARABINOGALACTAN PROTEIN 11 n=1 Tax=Salix koriyanagi TaxID=2511006 RepID=A0A9Q0X5L9_9ROSI|nr:FASCICLIN-LIKE ARABINOGALACTAN PROTEIN 11 [Salix koriyanagi]
MKSTQEADQINTQLNNSNQGLTVFAPTDNSFSSLKAGTLNSLSDQQKTVSNPLRTQAGNSADGEFPLNVTTSGNQVNITTGVNTATVANTIYTDGQLVVYQVDQVLLPLDLFGAAAAPAPAPSKPEKDVPAKAPAGSKEDASVDASGASIATVSFGAVLIAAISLKI